MSGAPVPGIGSPLERCRVSGVRPADLTTDTRHIFQSHSFYIVISRHVRQNHRIAGRQSLYDLDRVHRRATYFHRNANGIATAFDELEHPDRAVGLTIRGPAD